MGRVGIPENNEVKKTVERLMANHNFTYMEKAALDQEIFNSSQSISSGWKRYKARDEELTVVKMTEKQKAQAINQKRLVYSDDVENVVIDSRDAFRYAAIDKINESLTRDVIALFTIDILDECKNSMVSIQKLPFGEIMNFELNVRHTKSMKYVSQFPMDENACIEKVRFIAMDNAKTIMDRVNEYSGISVEIKMLDNPTVDTFFFSFCLVPDKNHGKEQ